MRDAERPRVLVVVGDPAELEGILAFLRPSCDVRSAPSGEAALAILAEESFAVIVADDSLRGISGSAILGAARTTAPLTRRILLTAPVDGLAAASVNNAEPHGFVWRPCVATELEAVVRRLASANAQDRREVEILVGLEQRAEELRLRELHLLETLDERARDLREAQAEIDRLGHQLAANAHHDLLTGLYSHCAFQERLREEVSRARRYHKPLSLILGDIDAFRRINEEHGHSAGDGILHHVAEILRGESGEHVRESDVLSRYGGEEFALLLPETPKPGARVLAERLCGLVRRAAFDSGLRATMSFGVAAFPEDAKNADELVRYSEAALASAKSAGRDRVAVFSDALLPAPAAAPLPGTGAALAASGYVDGWAQISAGDFPTYHERIFSIGEVLERDRAIGCLYVDLSRLRRVETEYGVVRHNDFMSRVGKMLVDVRSEDARRCDSLCRDGGDAFVYFLSASRARGDADLEQVSARVQETIDGALAREVFDLIHDHPRIAVGYARVLFNPMVRAERLIGRLVEDAKESASLCRLRQRARDKDLLQELILSEGLTPVYQPIVHLVSGEIFGFEALTRGPHRSPLEAPVALFHIAEEVNLLIELDRACVRGALRGARGLEPIHRLFVNLLPMSFYDTQFIVNEVGALLAAANLTPAHVVFEITEQLAIENFPSFKRALGLYTDMGFGVAIDDVGTKHSNLEAVIALRPHFVKLSDVLTRGAARSTVKREMLRSLGRISEAIDAVMVAEGIETAEDFAVLTSLGVRYGQGYFLARPEAPFPKLRAAVKRAVRSFAQSPAPIPVPPAQEFEEDEDSEKVVAAPGEDEGDEGDEDAEPVN